MQRKSVLIVNKLGLHARAAAKFVTLAQTFAAEITITNNKRTVNGKSIMGVMMLAAAKGATVEVSAEGADETAALQSLCELIANRFDEAE